MAMAIPLEKLPTVYKERIHYFCHQIDKIQNALIPKYKELCAKRHDDLSRFKTRNDDIEKKMNH